MSSSRLLRLFCIVLADGFLAGALVTVFLRWRRRAADSCPAIVLAEVSS